MAADKSQKTIDHGINRKGESDLDYFKGLSVSIMFKIDLHIARGMVSANGQILSTGDALMFSVVRYGLTRVFNPNDPHYFLYLT